MAWGSVQRFDELLERLDVLVVDDNQFTRKLVKGALQSLGVRKVLDACDGLEALDMITLHSPDVVFLDWEMPILNGPETVRTIRSPEAFPLHDIPIVMMSAHGEVWRVREAARLGVNEFIRKPISAKVLLDRLTMIVRKPRPMVRTNGYYGPAPRDGRFNPADIVTRRRSANDSEPPDECPPETLQPGAQAMVI